MTDGAIRVRFPPSPTGSPHVGLVRSMLFNWAFARHHGGTFVLRIEDTDAARNTQESYDGLFDLFGWLGLSWDEGPDIGGPHAPYRQSERGAIYRDALERLTAGGHTYRCYCTTDEVAARRQAAGSKDMGYDRFCRDLSAEQVAAFEAEGRAPVTRFRMPEGDIVFDDLVRGRVTFHSDHVPDYALARANGDPLYTLVNPLDDALMGITHVLRGEDLLSSTPRQVPAVRRPRRCRPRLRRPALRPPALRDGPGQQEAVEAGPGGARARLPRPGFPAGGVAELPGAARLVDRPRP